MNSKLNVLKEGKGRDGRYYQIVAKEDGWAVVSEGWSDKLGINVRLFEAECLTESEAKSFFTICIRN